MGTVANPHERNRVGSERCARIEDETWPVVVGFTREHLVGYLVLNDYQLGSAEPYSIQHRPDWNRIDMYSLRQTVWRDMIAKQIVEEYTALVEAEALPAST